MMKKILYIIACVALCFATSCSKESVSHEGEGAVSFALNNGTVRSGSATDPFAAVYDKLTFRIFQVSNKDTATETKKLVRLYTYDEIIGDSQNPMKIWLLAGDYRVEVSGGDQSEASFTEIYYKGSADFTVAENMSDKTIEVTCRPSNSMIKVVFDQSVADNMEDAKVVVAIDDSYDPIAVASKSVPSLTYTETKIGYFTPEEGATSFAWHFSGTVPAKNNQEVVKEAVQTLSEGFKAGYMYTITFKYSPDLGGYMTFDITVDKNPTEYNNIATFKPEPQFSDVDGAQVVNKTAYLNSSSEVSYNVKAINAITEVSVNNGSTTTTYTSDQVNGVSSASVRSTATFTDAENGVAIDVVSDKEWVITLLPKFMEKLSAGENEYIVSVTDDAGAIAEYVQDYLGEGVNNGVLKLWEGHAYLSAYVTNSAAQNIKVVYRKDSGDWQEIAAEASSSNNALWEVKLPVDGQAEFEYYWRYDGKENMSAANSTFSTPAAPQIPNGGLEEWAGDSPLLPYTTTQWWDTGNHGSATLNTNVTTNSTDVRPGSTGQYSAYLKSQYVAFMGIGKFAAGNIFFGKYLKTDGTNGIIGFGQPYEFVYKPKKLVVWYKGQVGTCDYAGGSVSKGDSDKNQIYVWLCNWTGRHAVNTGDTTTFVNPTETAKTAEGNVIAYGEWHRVITAEDSGADNGWQKLEIPITYREGAGFSDVVPNYLVISCAASGYGDYFAGSSSSYMYVDDIEFVY